VKNTIQLSRVHFPITALGPGNRIGIWFQGCSIRCPGCVSVDTWAMDKEAITIKNVMKQLSIWLPQATGITISGGEPFDQFPALKKLVKTIREQWVGDILIYSGYHFDVIKSQVDQFNGQVDAIISEPFISGEKQTLGLRGSDNQVLHYLTEKGRHCFASYQFPDDQQRTLDIMFDDEGTAWMAGIPRQQDLSLLKTLLNNNGHKIVVSEQPHKIKFKKDANL